MNPNRARSAFFLVGPTGVGKTAVAHRLARQHGWPVLSADAMLVYRGMNIGTAKPTPAERVGIRYGGIDLVHPDQPFSVGRYLQAAQTFLQTLPDDQPVMVVGGTGLYVNALLAGLDDMPPENPEVREAVQTLYAEEGLNGLQVACRQEAPERFSALRDPENPRRVMRALELARTGCVTPPTRWTEKVQGTVVGLSAPRELLHQRIALRVAQMLREGLLAEVAALQKRFPVWSTTAAKAIGYAEARAVCHGEMTEEVARDTIVQRTRQYARRQRTWFRRQLPVTFFERTERLNTEDCAEAVDALWRKYGPCTLVN